MTFEDLVPHAGKTLFLGQELVYLAPEILEQRVGLCMILHQAHQCILAVADALASSISISGVSSG